MTRDDDRFDRDGERSPDKNDDAVLREAEEVQERAFYGGFGGRQQSQSEHLWLISYSDFMTILMIFFLAMYGFTYLQKKKNEPPPMTVDQFTAAVSQLKNDMGEQIRVIDEFDKVTVELGEGVLFASGSAQLGDRAARTLASLADSIKRMKGDVIVEGHTDDVPLARGARYPSNWELSAARAFSVIQELKRGGVPGERLAAWGFGENRPRVANDSAENRRRNRRIDIVVLKQKTKNA